MRTRIAAPLLAALLSALPAAGSAAPARHTDLPTPPADVVITPPTADQQQRDAVRPIPVPATGSCTETVMVNDFRAYYQPFSGAYVPPSACPGPWAQVVMTLSSSVGGVQFDRALSVFVGGVDLLRGTTSEPCCSPTGNTVSWSVQRDVTDYQETLLSPQTVTVYLDNIVDSTYTGVYHTTLSFTFYETGDAIGVGAHADQVVGINAMPTVANEGMQLADHSTGLGAPVSVTFPRNLERLSADVYASGHGGCEEFWWSEPSQCGTGTPYRELAVLLDGRLAGFAPAFPTTYTGADGPGLWEPIPSPRAWNLRPYRLDLTPFVGTLVDGVPHTVTLGVLDESFPTAGDYWELAANLLEYLDSGSATTTGALLSASGPAAPSDNLFADPSGQGLAATDQSAHAATWTGSVTTSRGTFVTTVGETSSINSTEAGLAVSESWDWDNHSTVTSDAGPGVETDTHSVYGINTSQLTAFGVVDDVSTRVRVADGTGSWSNAVEEMRTAGPTGLAYMGAENERYGYSDSGGACYDRVLVSLAGQVGQQDDTSCPGAPSN
ncbi:MAG: peptide-N4-asparagine amidase [Candidatus Dormibacteria bacterium]